MNNYIHIQISQKQSKAAASLLSENIAQKETYYRELYTKTVYQLSCDRMMPIPLPVKKI